MLGGFDAFEERVVIPAWMKFIEERLYNKLSYARILIGSHL